MEWGGISLKLNLSSKKKKLFCFVFAQLNWRLRLMYAIFIIAMLREIQSSAGPMLVTSWNPQYLTSYFYCQKGSSISSLEA